MRQTFSVLSFIRKKHPIVSRSQTIVVRIMVNRHKAEMATHLKCYIKDWKPNKQ